MALAKYSAFANSIIASKSFRVQSSDVKQQLKIDSGASKSVQCHPYSSADGIAEVFSLSCPGSASRFNQFHVIVGALKEYHHFLRWTERFFGSCARK